MDQALLTPLNQIDSSLNTLLTSLTTTNTYSAAPAATQSLLDADDALSSALVQLKQHQANYSRILTLRAEAEQLQTQLRNTIRTCIELRTEIGQIHPSILADTDDEDDDEPLSPSTAKRENHPVAYDDLLSFAARIGKHNAAAAIEAERQSNLRHHEASRSKLQEANGSSTTQPTSQLTEPTAADGASSNINTTQESQAELAAINDTLAQQRAYRGMAFPAAEALRMGELGRLQYIREQDGEEAVEKEIERMVRESERVKPKETGVKGEMDDVSVSLKTEPASTLPERPSMYSASVPQQRPGQGQAALPSKPKKALDLDFPDSDEDDDDD